MKKALLITLMFNCFVPVLAKAMKKNGKKFGDYKQLKKFEQLTQLEKENENLKQKIKECKEKFENNKKEFKIKSEETKNAYRKLKKIEKELKILKQIKPSNPLPRRFTVFIGFNQLKKIFSNATEKNETVQKNMWLKKGTALVVFPAALTGVGLATWYLWDKKTMKSVTYWLSQTFTLQQPPTK